MYNAWKSFPMAPVLRSMYPFVVVECLYLILNPRLSPRIIAMVGVYSINHGRVEVEEIPIHSCLGSEDEDNFNRFIY